MDLTIQELECAAAVALRGEMARQAAWEHTASAPRQPDSLVPGSAAPGQQQTALSAPGSQQQWPPGYCAGQYPAGAAATPCGTPEQKVKIRFG